MAALESPQAQSHGLALANAIKSAVALTQEALNACSKHSMIDEMQQAAQHLAAVLGTLDPAMTGAALMLAQTCRASQYLQNIFLSSLPPATECMEAALVNQYLASLQRAEGSTVPQRVLDYISNSVTWKRLSVSPDFTRLVQRLPADVALICLQHQDSEFLCLAVCV